MRLRPVHVVIAVAVVASLALALAHGHDATILVGYLLFAGLLIAIPLLGRGYDSRIGGRKRAAAVKSAAEAWGLGFSKDDPANLVRSVPVTLFGDLPRRGCRNFMWGTWRGRSVVAFDFWSDDLGVTALFPPPHAAGDNGSAETQPVHSYVAARIDADCPPVLIERRGIRTIMHPTVAFQEAHFESGRFDRLFRVLSKDPRAASALVDQRMMVHLATLDPAVRVEVAGGWVALLGPLREPEDLRTGLDAVVALADHVPGVIRSLYPVQLTNVVNE